MSNYKSIKSMKRANRMRHGHLEASSLMISANVNGRRDEKKIKNLIGKATTATSAKDVRFKDLMKMKILQKLGRLG